MKKVTWVWSEHKNSLNIQKHKLPFELATRAFNDPLHVTILDPCDREERWRTYGRIGNLLVIVVHTEPVDIGEEHRQGRVISARKATKRERGLVDEAIYG